MTVWALGLLVAAADAGGLSDAGVVAFPNARLAFAKVMESRPSVLAVGEYHEVEGAPKVRSAVKRFTDELLPMLKGRAGALVLETWMTTGKCGEVEKQATAAVKETTRRPDTTEDELTALLNRSFALGLTNHMLLISCDEYRSMLAPDRQLDGEKSLTLVKNKIEEKALEAREKGEGGTPQRAIVLYGGALHNDLRPAEGFEGVTFGPSLLAATDGGYLELDLLVPEYVEKDEELLREPWFPVALAVARSGRAALVQPSAGSWVLIFPKTRARR